MWLVKHDVDAGRLNRVLAEFERSRTPVNAVLATRGAAPSKVRALIEFLTDRYRAQGILSPQRLVAVSE
jgi:DNA-binding transcriptional LysR family regulator